MAPSRLHVTPSVVFNIDTTAPSGTGLAGMETSFMKLDGVADCAPAISDSRRWLNRGLGTADAFSRKDGRNVFIELAELRLTKRQRSAAR